MNENEFLIELQAKLDEAKSKGNINEDILTIAKAIDSLKLQAEIDPNSVKNIANQLSKIMNQKIVVDNIQIDTKQFENVSAKIGKSIGSSINKQAYEETAKAHAKLKSEMNDIVQKDNFKISFSASESVEDIKEYFKTLSATVSVKEKLDKGTGNEGFIVSLKNAAGVVEELKYKYNELTDAFEYTGGSINDSGIIKQINAITAKADSLQTSIDKIKASYSDMNSQNPIKEEGHISALEQQYDKIANSINDLRSADNTTFSSMVSNVNKEIAALEAMVSAYRKAETVSIHMKGTALTSAIEIRRNDLEKLKADAKDFPQMVKTISELDAAINKVSDPSSLYEFNDQLRVARAELAKIKSETSAMNRNEKVGINVSGLQSKIDDLRRISPEIDLFKAKIGEADVTVETLYDDLRKVNTQGDFSVINSKWRAFTDAAKAAGIAITEVEANSKKSIGWLGKLGDSLKGQMKSIGSNLLQTFSIASGFMFVSSKVKETISEMKELDDTLTEISKTSDLTSQELKDLGISAYDSASKYGKTASDYLTGVQSMSQSGFYGEQGEAMAKQSLLAQAAGDMSAELADKYILATNAAYKLSGNTEKINEILDGQNMVANRNSVAMADMAAGMSKAGTVASSYNVAVEDLTAMIGTMEAVTKSGGEEVGNAVKSILINLQNVNSDKITGTLEKANASMTEFVNGAEKLRNPIDIIRDLAKTFNELDEDDPLRAEIITNVATKYQASRFSALLQNMDMFDKMLVDFSEGSGSAMEEANKSANNLSGAINKVSNSWNEFVNTFVNTGELTSAVNVLNNLLQTVTNIVDKLGSLGTIGLGAGLFTGIKNTGKCRISVRIS